MPSAFRTLVDFVTYDHGDRWCSEQTLRFHVPTLATQQSVSGGGQTGEVGHGRSCDESHTCVFGQSQEGDEPLAAKVLEVGPQGRQHAHGDVLIPGRSQHVRRHGRRQTAAHNKAEVPAACGSHRRR
jgi:hypothetical protein